MMARQTKLTDDAQEQYVRAVAAGVVPEVAARHAGFSAASLYRYLKATTPRHAEFRDAHERALASLEIRLTATISQAALSEPRWAMALLERRFPSRWAQGRIERRDDPLDRAPDEPPIPLDPALIDLLIPRLLEAGRQLSGRTDDIENIVDFEDDGVPRDDPERLP
jgi:hypothetical protein